HALDELDVLEPPVRELLLVLQQRLGEKEQQRRTGSEIQVGKAYTLPAEQREKQLLQRWTAERVAHERRNLPMLFQRVHEVRVAKPRRRLDGAELHALGAARRAEIATKSREVLRWECCDR